MLDKDATKLLNFTDKQKTEKEQGIYLSLNFTIACFQNIGIKGMLLKQQNHYWIIALKIIQLKKSGSIRVL